MNVCTICGKKVSKKRRGEGTSPLAGFFCSNKCHITYADQMLVMMRETELEVEDEIRRETGTLDTDSWVEEALDALDRAAANATAGSRSPEEVAAKFVGSVAGRFGVKFATHLYGRFAERVKNWTQNKAKAANGTTQSTSTNGKPTASDRPTTTGQQAPQEKQKERKPPTPTQQPSKGAAGPQAKWRRTPEPDDLDELPLEEQREWLLRRFILPPTATLEDVKAKYKILAKKYHPDNRETGNGKLMAIINNTKSRLERIESELARTKKPRGRKR